MDIHQFRVVVRARNFDRTCRFYRETLALPEVESWQTDDLRGVLFDAGCGVFEVVGRPAGAIASSRDEQFDYQGPSHKLTVTLVVPSAEKAYEDLLFRDKNVPGGLRREERGAMIFETHDPDGLKIVYREAASGESRG